MGLDDCALTSLNDTLDKLGEDRRRHAVFSAAKPQKIGPPPVRPRPRKIYILLTGAPGSGVSTIAKKLVDEMGFYTISSGEMLHAEAAANTELGKEAKSFMDAGELVPDEIVLSLLLCKLRETSADRILLIGFPGTLEQARNVDLQVKIDMVFRLDVPITECISRIAARWIHVASGRSYSYDYNPPKEDGQDDESGEALEQRSDDKPEAIRKRIDAFEEVNAPMLQLFASKGVLIECDGSDHEGLIKKNRRSDAIYDSIKAHLGKTLSITTSTAGL
eukprot:TRINITY_DN67523_c0_g1_i1.p1 TRINITY_DN67523_c0_g1~~TRINITY_DN67523_c0_g1_i1.p1  ORF type:complete len:290 (-),score=59.87 TRINITY_DN67523_c0_g1_i1:90-917(-)